MHILLILSLLLVVAVVAIPVAFAEIDLSNEKIVSTDDNLILQFTDNTFRIFQTHTEIIPHLDFGIVDLGNVEIFLEDAHVNVLGDSFTVKNDSVALYAKSIGDDKFRINVYIFTDSGLQKTTFTANIIPPEPVIIVEPEIIEEPVKEKYQPELIINSSHDFTTYWKEIFNIDVQTYDANINPKATGFEGKLDGAIVNVILSLDDTNITLRGITEYGNWDGEYYFADNISKPEEYAVDIIVSYLGQTVSKSSSMFIIGTTTDSGSPNRDFDNDGILNVDDACPNDPEDFAGVGEDVGPPPVGDGCPEP